MFTFSFFELDKEIDKDGNEVIKDKKVCITENGKRVQLDDETLFQFETEGDDMTVIIDGKELDHADLTGGKFEGDKNVFIIKKEASEGNIK
jgi:hypothetical protein